MAEVRYRGTKVVTVSPDYADNVKFADSLPPAQAGTDAALAMAMGHVMLRRELRRAPGAGRSPTTCGSGTPTCRCRSPWSSTPTVAADRGEVLDRGRSEGGLDQPDQRQTGRRLRHRARGTPPPTPRGAQRHHGQRHSEGGQGTWNLELGDLTSARSACWNVPGRARRDRAAVLRRPARRGHHHPPRGADGARWASTWSPPCST